MSKDRTFLVTFQKEMEARDEKHARRLFEQIYMRCYLEDESEIMIIEINKDENDVAFRRCLEGLQTACKSFQLAKESIPISALLRYICGVQGELHDWDYCKCPNYKSNGEPIIKSCFGCQHLSKGRIE